MSMPWLRPTWQQLMTAARHGRLGHAIGIGWYPELGSDALIQEFAQWLLCQQKAHATRACGHCKNCLLMDSGHHPDLIQFGHDANQSIGIDDIRAVQQKLSQSAHQDGEKVATLVNAQLLTTAAANALLKTLEEPPGATTVIVASNAWQRLLPTIRSRLQHYPVVAPNVEELAQWLSQQSQQPISAQASLHGWCEKPLAALELLQQGQALVASDDLVTIIKQGSLPKSYQTVSQALGLLTQLEWVTRDSLWLRQGGALSLCRQPDLCAHFGLARRVKERPELIHRMLELQRQGTHLRQLLTGAKGLNLVVLMQGLLSQWQSIMQINSIGAVRA